MEMFLRYTSEPMISTSVEIQLERALAYFIYRHTAKACDEAELRAYLGFCLFCERLLASVTSDNEDITELARIVSEELEYSEDNTYTISEEFML